MGRPRVFRLRCFYERGGTRSSAIRRSPTHRLQPPILFARPSPARSYILPPMLRTKALLNSSLLIFCLSLNALAQNPSSWKIKPEWVRAHEMFLASDAVRGRGSATPDELIAATYVVSEFVRFGLKPGAPDGTFIQRVELVQPVIEGKATLSTHNSGVALERGKDFLLS